MNPWYTLEPHGWQASVEIALAEDIGTGDISLAAIPDGQLSDWYIEAQCPGVLCGVGVAAHILQGAGIRVLVADGNPVSAGTIVAEGRGLTRELLTKERLSLNYLMMLSGVSTLTAQFVELTKGTNARIIDTRKTIPGLRGLQKYAVRCGGGHNHRMGLYDGAMLKDNHIKACGSIAAAVHTLRASISHMAKIEVECETMEMVEQAIAARADVILLDNMKPADMKSVIDRFGGQCLFEASGGVNLASVRAIAESGVDLISVGALTHSAPSLPLHLEIQ